jgi:hypothetical protein
VANESLRMTQYLMQSLSQLSASQFHASCMLCVMRESMSETASANAQLGLQAAVEDTRQQSFTKDTFA